MAFRTDRWGRTLRGLALAAAAAGLASAGCGKWGGPAPAAQADAPAAAAAPPPKDARHQPFTKATRREDDPPAECGRPPDTTHTGKPVYKLYKEVVRLWDAVRFVTPEG